MYVKKFACLLPLILLATPVEAQPALRLKTWKRGRPVRSTSLDAAAKTRTPGRSHLLVQFAKNPGEDQLAELSQRSARVLSYVPDAALSIAADDGTSFDGLDVRWIGKLQPGEKISPDMEVIADQSESALVEFYSDVDPNDARVIVNTEGLTIRENPDVLAHHLLVSGSPDQFRALARWDEVAYVFPAAPELLAGTPVWACAGAITALGSVGQSVALIDDGWDGPGKGSADLQYAFAHLTDKLPVDSEKSEIARALREWAKYAKLTFSESSITTNPRTISVLFASGTHGDFYPFDGPGGVIAHTFYPIPTNVEPIAGDMHFDNDENWKIGADVDLFSIALHEAGHALGLGHSDNPNAVMYPYYHRHTELSADDITAIRQLYAAQEDAMPDPNLPTPPLAPTPPASPLTLTVEPPPGSTAASSIALRGTTSGGVGTAQVSWATNQGNSGAAQGSANWTIAAIPLVTGTTIITITARDSAQGQVMQYFNVARQQPAAPIGPDQTPPSMAVLSPATTTVYTSSASITVTGTATDDVGVAKVTWTSSTGGSGTASGTTRWTASAPLYVGTTTLVIRAFDTAGNSSWRSIVVTRK